MLHLLFFICFYCQAAHALVVARLNTSDAQTGVTKFWPRFLDDNGSGSIPWGARTAKNTDPYNGYPDTGVTREYTIIASRSIRSPDGFIKRMILFNDTYPGPTIEANWGDWIKVTVINNITAPEEGLSLHWHGLPQQETPLEDGTIGVTQCPIAPSRTFTYRFRASRFGTSWYHSHYTAQLMDGAFGALVIYGPEHVDYDADLGPVLVHDLRHLSHDNVIQGALSAHLSGSLNFDTNFNISGVGQHGSLLNGAAYQYRCQRETSDKCNPDWRPSFSRFHLEKGKKYKLRLINAGADTTQKFSVDGHKITVVANDFTQVQPYEVDAVTLTVGQRSDIIIEAVDQGGSFWARSRVSWCVSTIWLWGDESRIALHYGKNDMSIEPSSKTGVDKSQWCGNDDHMKVKPYYAIPVEKPDVTLHFRTWFWVNGTGYFTLTINGQPFKGNFSETMYAEAYANPSRRWNVDPREHMYNVGSNKTVRVVLTNPTPLEQPHPFHFHGHDMTILGEGLGWWDGKESSLVYDNPNRRDVHLLRLSGYMVFQYTTDNPGIWALHCHIPWHIGQGLVVNLMEHPDKIAQMRKVPSRLNDSCADWREWQKDNLQPIDQN